MNFTPQQLAGGVRYGSKTRVGNWLEDVCLEETKFADFKRARGQGTLTMGKFNTKVHTCQQAVPHTFSEDGTLRYGDSIVLAHMQTGGSLACDPFEAAGFEANEFNASVCSSTESSARNTFIICKYDERDPSDTVSWGVPFRLMCNPSLRIDDRTSMLQPPLYLASSLKNERKASPISNNQLVFLTAKAAYNSVWVANAPAVNKNAGAARLMSVGHPIIAGCDVTIQHCGTKQLLASDSKNSLSTDFGTEFEVCGATVAHTGKVSVLRGEASGLRTAQTNVKPEMSQNIWSFVTSSNPDYGFEWRNLPNTVTAEGLVVSVLEVLKSRSRYCVRMLKSKLRSMDDNGDFKVDCEDLKWCLKDLGVDFNGEQFALLFSHFDPKSDGVISMTEFTGAMRGEMNERRMALVLEAYRVLDVDGITELTIDDLISTYNNPEISVGEFRTLWEVDKKGVVSSKEFVEFYKDFSAEIEDDDVFEQILVAGWRL